ncbi:hypothetical protein [Nocardia vulneris]|uniref:Uncharacterized protein n=1 Tax=Nocardia vulneris TaxID=1141657 RepID=A0ABR4ZCN0_9NOCA|nr:hypothetical protein [Nocardia vulneris]KIA63026.1 hypothetical protein FG87_21930 [Nocardia vulneris]
MSDERATAEPVRFELREYFIDPGSWRIGVYDSIDEAKGAADHECGGSLEWDDERDGREVATGSFRMRTHIREFIISEVSDAH